MKTLKTLVGGMVLLTAFPIGAGEKLQLRVTPTMGMAPADVRITATVEPDVNNRAIEIVAESEEFYRSSRIPLEGADAARTSIFRFRSLPAGSYQVSAALIGNGGKVLVSVRQPAQVFASARR
jgi:hypothetical protein